MKGGKEHLICMEISILNWKVLFIDLLIVSLWLVQEWANRNIMLSTKHDFKRLSKTRFKAPQWVRKWPFAFSEGRLPKANIYSHWTHFFPTEIRAVWSQWVIRSNLFPWGFNVPHFPSCGSNSKLFWTNTNGLGQHWLLVLLAQKCKQ